MTESWWERKLQRKEHKGGVMVLWKCSELFTGSYVQRTSAHVKANVRTLPYSWKPLKTSGSHRGYKATAHLRGQTERKPQLLSGPGQKGERKERSLVTLPAVTCCRRAATPLFTSLLYQSLSLCPRPPLLCGCCSFLFSFPCSFSMTEITSLLIKCSFFHHLGSLSV